jgi:hypothetical protein
MTDDTAPAAAPADSARAAAPVSPCGLTVNLATARDMIAGGQKHENVAAWLHATMKGHPEELDSIDAASAAINEGST